MNIRAQKTQKITLTPQQQAILRNQVIDEQQPGALLHDFEVMLAFVQAETPLKVTGQNSLIPLKYLRELNERLSHPIRLDMKRPQFKSFPNIAGVYLLLRASGLTYLTGSNKTSRLVVDEAAVTFWHDLNPSERYFNLLETWAFRARPEILGEPRGGLFSDSLQTWRDLFQRRMPDQEMSVAGNKENEETLKFWVDYYNLPLLEMFGFLRIQDAEPEAGKGWNIVSIQKTPFGEAMLAAFAPKIPNWDEFDVFKEKKNETNLGALQPLLQSYFPEWQNNLVIPEPEHQEETYIFKVILWGKIWRRIAISGDMALDALAAAILNAYRFDFDHLYRFTFKNRFGLEQHINHPMLEESPFTDEVKVQDLPLQPGMSMIFFYDFGDQWEFVVQLEQVTPLNPAFKTPKVLKKHGKSPDQYRW